MKKVFYKIVNPIRKIYWYIFRPKTAGVKCLIENSGRFLMIRNSYGHKNWTFPGGGVRQHEKPEEAAKREVFEEVGIDLSNVAHIGEYFSTRQYKRDTVHCYYVMVDNANFNIDNNEIEEASWFSKNEIPGNRSVAVDEVINLYRLKF